ncbi:MAG: hypothetical protein HKN70_05310 [Gammaproteobacteria bacterium]|nr:hypothetical protein [Gammaproteobacteria bacterium]
MRSLTASALLAALLTMTGCVQTRDVREPPSPTLQDSGFGKAHPAAAVELQQFGRFAGRWECAMSERTADGQWRMRPSKVNWTWFYTLEGRAVQDIWMSQSGTADSQVIATNLRLFDAASQQWNVAWTNTGQAQFELWTGGQVGDELVLTSVREQRTVRIRFYEIMPRRFKWMYEAATSRTAEKFQPVLQMLCQRLD